jgi:hypothetical protein
MPSRKGQNLSNASEPKLAIDSTSQAKDLNLFPHLFYAVIYGLECQKKTLIELTMKCLSGVI